MLKPTGGAASIGVLRVDDAAQLLAGFRRVRMELSRCVANSSGVLVQIAAGEPVPDGCRAVECALMLEEYLDGQARCAALRCAALRCAAHRPKMPKPPQTRPNLR